MATRLLRLETMSFETAATLAEEYRRRFPDARVVPFPDENGIGIHGFRIENLPSFRDHWSEQDWEALQELDRRAEAACGT